MNIQNNIVTRSLVCFYQGAKKTLEKAWSYIPIVHISVSWDSIYAKKITVSETYLSKLQKESENQNRLLEELKDTQAANTALQQENYALKKFRSSYVQKSQDQKQRIASLAEKLNQLRAEKQKLENENKRLNNELSL